MLRPRLRYLIWSLLGFEWAMLEFLLCDDLQFRLLAV